MTYQIWISVIALLIMAGGLYGIFFLIVKQNATLGIKTIQLLTVVFMLPTIIILGVNNILRTETIGTLLGVLAGWVLSGAWKDS